MYTTDFTEGLDNGGELQHEIENTFKIKYLFLLFLNSLPMLAPGNCALLSCSFNLCSPSPLGVSSYSPCTLSWIVIFPSPLSLNLPICHWETNILLLDYVMYFNTPMLYQVPSPPMLNLKMLLGIHPPYMNSVPPLLCESAVIISL